MWERDNTFGAVRNWQNKNGIRKNETKKGFRIGFSIP